MKELYKAMWWAVADTEMAVKIYGVRGLGKVITVLPKKVRMGRCCRTASCETMREILLPQTLKDVVSTTSQTCSCSSPTDRQAQGGNPEGLHGCPVGSFPFRHQAGGNDRHPEGAPPPGGLEDVDQRPAGHAGPRLL